MKLSALALDYDGTVADDGVFDSSCAWPASAACRRSYSSRVEGRTTLTRSRGIDLLEVIRWSEQALIIAFNRGRLMVLPQAISKVTGLRSALFALRISAHNTIGIGNAENDHDLLGACEVGAAVAWGAPPAWRVPSNP